MAQPGTALQRADGNPAIGGYGVKELHEIQQYDKILRFRDRVLSGQHPTIRLPPGASAGLDASASAASQNEPQVTSSDSQWPSQTQHGSPSRGHGHDGTRPLASVDSTRPSNSQSFVPGNADINPIFLEKSEDLIRAEIQIQRQRLERALKEELDQHRATKNDDADSAAELDLSDVLTKALSLVQASSAPVPAADVIANNEASNDSFDDDTFYSSRHDTPESRLISRVSEEPGQADAPSPAYSVQARHQKDGTGMQTITSPVTETCSAGVSQPIQPAGIAGTTSIVPANSIPGLNNYVDRGNPSIGTSTNTSGIRSVAGESSHGNTGQQQDGNAISNMLGNDDDLYADMYPPSPRVRNHDLVPVAPQPVQISSLATRPDQSVANRQQDLASGIGPPPQVAALRQAPVEVTSPESSSQGGKGPEKRKGKKKKRKADRQAPEAETPYIKPEPRSASPVTAPSYIRPNKRQRQSQGQVQVQQGPETRYENQAAHIPQAVYQSNSNRDERGQADHPIEAPYLARAASTTVATGPRYGAEYINSNRISSDAYVRRRPSPAPDAAGYSPREVPPPRAVSQMIMSDPYREAPRYQPPYDAPRFSVRPDGETAMAPPHQPPTRIFVDAYGREYIEPPRATIRQSVAPPFPNGEPEVMYERPPLRAVSRPGVAERYEDGGTVYTDSSSTYRRYVTQPEVAHQDYRERPMREYSTMPVGYQGGLVQVGGPHEVRQGGDRPREYIARTASARPPDPALYGGGYEEYGRTHTARPEASRPEYRASLYPERRQGPGTQPYLSNYGGQPVQQPVQQPVGPPDFGVVRPVEQFQHPYTRAPEGIAFIERPRAATQEIVYADDVRREVYR